MPIEITVNRLPNGLFTAEEVTRVATEAYQRGLDEAEKAMGIYETALPLLGLVERMLDDDPADIPKYVGELREAWDVQRAALRDAMGALGLGGEEADDA